jgi:hypothetical protein
MDLVKGMEEELKRQYIVKSTFPIGICDVCSCSTGNIIPTTVVDYGLYEVCENCLQAVFDMNDDDIDTYRDAYEYETILPLVPTQKWLEFERQRIKSMLTHLNKQLSVIESKTTLGATVQDATICATHGDSCCYCNVTQLCDCGEKVTCFCIMCDIYTCESCFHGYDCLGYKVFCGECYDGPRSGLDISVECLECIEKNEVKPLCFVVKVCGESEFASCTILPFSDRDKALAYCIENYNKLQKLANGVDVMTLREELHVEL